MKKINFTIEDLNMDIEMIELSDYLHDVVMFIELENQKSNVTINDLVIGYEDINYNGIEVDSPKDILNEFVATIDFDNELWELYDSFRILFENEFFNKALHFQNTVNNIKGIRLK